MKLVITYATGDYCSWSATEVKPLEYESAEAFIVEFEEAIKKARAEYYAEQKRWHDALELCRKGKGPIPKIATKDFTTIRFAGHVWEWRDFFDYNDRDKYIGPDHIQTLDDWFEENKTREY